MSFFPETDRPNTGRTYRRPGRHRWRRSPFSWGRPVMAAAVLLAILPIAGYGASQYWPGYAPPPLSPRVVVGDYVCQQPALVDAAGRVFLTFETVKSLFAPDIVLDQASQVVTISTQGRPVRMATDALTQFLTAKPVDLNVPVTADAAGTPHVPLDFFASLLGLDYEYHPESNTVTVDRFGDQVLTATVQAEKTFVRETPSLFSLKLARLAQGDVVRIYGERKGSYYVRDAAGRLGYVPVKSVTPGSVTTVGPDPAPGTSLPSLEGKKISLVWEHVSGPNPNPADIGDMPSLNVVSPTWFHVVDTEGTVQNLGDSTYVKWAHERGYQVWGLVTNGFNRSRTRAFLPDPAKREKIIRQLLYYAGLYDLDGINLDFENMYLSEKDDYVALARELTPLAHQQGLTVSVDVTFLSSSEVWSRCFDRPALAEICDYVMVMAYDEHTSGSDHSGSVGSLPWVEYGLARILNEAGVPPEKCILGVPFYTRLWAEVPGRRPTVTTYSMQGVKNLIAEKGLTPVWDSEAGQYYIEYKEDGVRYRLWIEDEISMIERVRLVHEYGLAGIAAWRRGYELPIIWQAIDRELNGKG